jgi:DNA-binding MarR family transcriptional regulator
MLWNITIKGEVAVNTKPGLASETSDGADPSLVDLVGYALRRAHIRMMADLAVTLEPTGLRRVLAAMLAVIRANPGIIQMGLGTELGIQRANLVPLINELTALELIDRRPAPHDRRALALFLTEKGEAEFDRAFALILDHEDRTLARLTVGERKQLIGLLDKIATD